MNQLKKSVAPSAGGNEFEAQKGTDGAAHVMDHTEGAGYLELAEVSGSYTYYGRCLCGSSRASADAIWQVQRRKTDGTESTWADGDTKFDNIWANRASLTYPVAT